MLLVVNYGLTSRFYLRWQWHMELSRINQRYRQDCKYMPRMTQMACTFLHKIKPEKWLQLKYLQELMSKIKWDVLLQIGA